MHRPSHRYLQRLIALAMVVMMSGAPLLATAQSSTPDASPEAMTEDGYQVIKSSVTTIESPAEGGEALEILHTELRVEPGGTVPGIFPHYGTVTLFVQAGSICYTLEDAPAATVSFLTTGYPQDEPAPSTVDCGGDHEPCEAICAVPRGEPLLLTAGDSITHIVPINVGPTDPGGLIHSYYNPDTMPAWVTGVEITPVMFAESCHGGCPP